MTIRGQANLLGSRQPVTRSVEICGRAIDPASLGLFDTRNVQVELQPPVVRGDDLCIIPWLGGDDDGGGFVRGGEYWRLFHKHFETGGGRQVGDDGNVVLVARALKHERIAVLDPPQPKGPNICRLRDTGIKPDPAIGGHSADTQSLARSDLAENR